MTELKPTGIYVTKLIYNNYLIITYLKGNIKGYYMAIFISYPISIRDTHIIQVVQSTRANIGFMVWYGYIVLLVDFFYCYEWDHAWPNNAWIKRVCATLQTWTAFFYILVMVSDICTLKSLGSLSSGKVSQCVSGFSSASLIWKLQ